MINENADLESPLLPKPQTPSQPIEPERSSAALDKLRAAGRRILLQRRVVGMVPVPKPNDSGFNSASIMDEYTPREHQILEVIDYTKTNALHFEVEAGKLTLELFPANAIVIPQANNNNNHSSRPSTSTFAPLTEAIATDSNSSVSGLGGGGGGGGGGGKPLNADVSPAPALSEKDTTRWIQRHGREPVVLRHLAKLYKLSSTTVETILQCPQSALFRQEDHYTLIITQVLKLKDDDFMSEPCAILLVEPNVVITLVPPNFSLVFRELISKVLRNSNRLREKGAYFLLSQVLQSVAESAVPVISHYGDIVEDLELDFTSTTNTNKREHRLRLMEIKRELLLLRKAHRPQGEVLDSLLAHNHDEDDETKELAYRSAFQEVRQKYRSNMEILETYRELCTSIQELVSINNKLPHLSSLVPILFFFFYLPLLLASCFFLLRLFLFLFALALLNLDMDSDHELNRVLYVLTMVTTIFVPCSFLAGVYGMNFKYIPELNFRYSYPIFWAVIVTIMASLAFAFSRFKRAG